MKQWVLTVFDALIVVLAAALALLVRHDFNFEAADLPTLTPYLGISLAVATTVFSIGRSHRPLWRFASINDLLLLAGLVALIVGASSLIAFLGFRLEGIPRSVPPLQALFALLAMGGARIFARSAVYRPTISTNEPRASMQEHVLVVGLSRVADLYIRCVEELGAQKYSVEGLLDESEEAQGRFLRNKEVLGSPARLPSILASMRVHGIEISRIVIAKPFAELSEASRHQLTQWERQGEVTLDLFEERLGFRSQPQTEEVPSQSAQHSLFDSHNGELEGSTAETEYNRAAREFAAFHAGGPNNTVAINRKYFKVKRALDVLGALALLVLLFPFILVSGAITALNVGFPIIFWQVRPGIHGKPIRIHKFRTMGSAHDASGRHLSDAERLTAVGRLLRRIRFDEFPQLVDVLAGRMSFIGPRPLLPKDLPIGTGWRFQVRPGITGWAQVNGGHALSAVNKVQLDRWYLENANLWLDIKILFLTALVLIRGDKINWNAVERAHNAMEKNSDKPAGSFSRAGERAVR